MHEVIETVYSFLWLVINIKIFDVSSEGVKIGEKPLFNLLMQIRATEQRRNEQQ